jgi:hypothetical protein
MRIFKKALDFGVLCGVLVLAPVIAVAGLSGIEVLSGFGEAKLIAGKGKYKYLPLFVGLDFDLKPCLKRKNINFSQLFQFVLEPFGTYVLEPQKNAEFGTNLALKAGFLPDTWKFQPYLKGGIGVIYITTHVKEQGTQFNFNEYGGIGAHFFFSPKLAFTAEYRFRHLSNADIKEPNHGIGSSISLAGITYFF